MSTTKILTLTSSDTESSSFYRGLGPLYRLAKAYPDEIEIIKKREFNWSDFIEPHVAFLLRPSQQRHVALMARLKNFGVKVVIDWDDDIFSVPENHQDFEVLSSDLTRNSVVQCAQLADEIWVTTPRLKEVFAKFTADEKVIVIPNAIDDLMYPEPTTPFAGDGCSVIGWRGSKTHGDDLMGAGKIFKDLTQHGINFVFLGYRPAPEMSNIGVKRESWSNIGIEDIDLYFKTLKRLNLPFHFVPLEETDFNKSKSNIAYLESAWIGGSLPIVPAMWSDLCGAIVYNSKDPPGLMLDPKDPSRLTADLLSMTEKNRILSVFAAQESIRANFLLSKVNETRRMRFKDLRFAK